MRSLFVTLIASLFAATPAVAQSWADTIDFSGYIESDTRVILDDYRGLNPGGLGDLEINRNEVNMRLGITPNDQVRAVIDTRLRYFGFSQAEQLPDLVSRSKVDPFSIYLDEAYFAARGVVFESMDLRIGRLIQNWGAVDQFNPTDNLNSRDLSDPLDFTKKVPNQMVELALYPSEWLDLTAVWVPVFKPAQLPPSANLAFAVEYDEMGKFETAPIPPLSFDQMEVLVDYFNNSVEADKLRFVDTQVRVLEPGRNITNSQVAAKAKLYLGPLDLTLSYYYGRFGFPVAYTAVAKSFPRPDVPANTDVEYVAEVMYPRMQVAGLDFTYSANWLFGMGFMGEVAVIFPEQVDFGLRIYNGTKIEENMALTNVAAEPFIKGTFGMDYTFPFGVYVNAMYVHGFFDEFNDLYGLHDYLVAATEFKFFDDELAFRLAGVWDITQLETGTFNPQITWVVVPSVEVQAVGMWFFGDTAPPGRKSETVKDPDSGGLASIPLYQDKWRFGQKAAGRNVVSLRGRVTW